MIKITSNVKMIILIGTVSCFVSALSLIVLTDKDILRPGWKVSGPVMVKTELLNLLDTSRDRSIPVLLYSEKNFDSKNLKLVIIAHGHGIRNSDYSYIANNLAIQGHAVASVQYELPEDENLDLNGNVQEILTPVWEDAVKSILYVTKFLKNKYPNLDCQNLILIGHSRGADIVMLFAQKYPEMVSKVIALDNGHFPILRTRKPQILSLRSNNTHPDDGVLPTVEEQKKFNIQIVKLKDISHLDMCFGSTDQKGKINKYITDFLNE
jgi:predicted peptidase